MTKALPPPERKVLHGEIIPPREKLQNSKAYYTGVDFGSLVGTTVKVVIRNGTIIHMSRK